MQPHMKRTVLKKGWRAVVHVIATFLLLFFFSKEAEVYTFVLKRFSTKANFIKERSE